MPVTDQGPLSGRYTLIPRTLIFLTSGDRVLLIKGAPHKRLWADLYNGVGGHVERGEDILSAARRELLEEETSIQGVDLRLCAIVTIDAGSDTGIGVYVLRGEYALAEIANIPGETAISHPFHSAEGSLEWVPLSRLNELPLVEDLHTLLPRVLALQTEDPPLSLLYQYEQDGKMKITFAK